MVKVKEVHVEYFYTKQPRIYESERLVIGLVADSDDVDVAKVADELADACMEIVHRRLGLIKKEETNCVYAPLDQGAPRRRRI